MGWPFNRRDAQITPADMLGWRTSERASLRHRNVSRDEALRHSAVWACLRLRADLISSMPIDVYRRMNSMLVEMSKPPVLQSPDGRIDFDEWAYASQNDLDAEGNTVAIIKATNGFGQASLLEPVPLGDVSVHLRGGVVKYKVGGEDIDASRIWHERQYPVTGIPVGLSPIAKAASTVYGYLSAQQFAADWFSGTATPRMVLKNAARRVNAAEADTVKRRYKASMTDGDVFVTGNDWDFKLVDAQASTFSFLDERNAGVLDICRFLSVPGDMIDANTASGSITYANITQRNLQLLVMNLGGAVRRRERAWSKLVPSQQFVKLNREALLSMDIAGRYESYSTAIEKRFMAPSEVRALENRPPFTPEQIAEFDALFPRKQTTPTAVGS
jgi:HK97 family phage portal protein